SDEAPVAAGTVASKDAIAEGTQEYSANDAAEHDPHEQAHLDETHSSADITQDAQAEEADPERHDYDQVDGVDAGDADDVYDDTENIDAYTEHEESYGAAYDDAETPDAEGEEYQEELDAPEEEGYEYEDNYHEEHDTTEVTTQNDPASDGHEDGDDGLDKLESREDNLATEYDQDDGATAHATADETNQHGNNIIVDIMTLITNFQADFQHEVTNLPEKIEPLTELSADVNLEVEDVLSSELGNDDTTVPPNAKTPDRESDSGEGREKLQLRSTASKRSFDEHEDDDEESTENYTGETKRLKVD
ncbi:hypothetical protein M422DRAFT_276366, partial [Sphaerobolus stellatus SS14]